MISQTELILNMAAKHGLFTPAFQYIIISGQPFPTRRTEVIITGGLGSTELKESVSSVQYWQM